MLSARRFLLSRGLFHKLLQIIRDGSRSDVVCCQLHHFGDQGCFRTCVACHCQHIIRRLVVSPNFLKSASQQHAIGGQRTFCQPVPEWSAVRTSAFCCFLPIQLFRCTPRARGIAFHRQSCFQVAGGVWKIRQCDPDHRHPQIRSAAIRSSLDGGGIKHFRRRIVRFVKRIIATSLISQAVNLFRQRRDFLFARQRVEFIQNRDAITRHRQRRRIRKQRLVPGFRRLRNWRLWDWRSVSTVGMQHIGIHGRCQDVNHTRINLRIGRRGLHHGLHVHIHVQHQHGRSNCSAAEVRIQTGRVRPARIASNVVNA